MTSRTARVMAKGSRRLVVVLGSLVVLVFGSAGVARADEPCPPTDVSCLSTVGDTGNDTLNTVTDTAGQAQGGQASETMQQAEDAAAQAVQTAQDTVQTVEDTVRALVGDVPDPGGKDPGDGDQPPGNGVGGPAAGGTRDDAGAPLARGHRADANGGSTRGSGLFPTPGAGGEVQGVLSHVPTNDPTFGRTVAGLAFHLILPLCLLAGLALLFVGLQGRIDRRDPHLAGAPVVPDVLRFE